MLAVLLLNGALDVDVAFPQLLANWALGEEGCLRHASRRENAGDIPVAERE